MSVAVFRSEGEVVVAELRHKTGRSVPFNRRFIAQKRPSIRTEKCELVRLVVSTPEGTRVLTMLAGQRGVPLPERERQWLLRNVLGTVVVRCGRWQVQLPKGDWQQILRSWRSKYPVIERRWDDLEVSADGERWFRVSLLITDRSH